MGKGLWFGKRAVLLGPIWHEIAGRLVTCLLHDSNLAVTPVFYTADRDTSGARGIRKAIEEGGMVITPRKRSGLVSPSSVLRDRIKEKEPANHGGWEKPQRQ